MPSPVHKQARAKRDLVEYFVYLVENASMETAERFLPTRPDGVSIVRVLPAHRIGGIFWVSHKRPALYAT
jgi:hypothetical protein